MRQFIATTLVLALLQATGSRGQSTSQQSSTQQVTQSSTTTVLGGGSSYVGGAGYGQGSGVNIISSGGSVGTGAGSTIISSGSSLGSGSSVGIINSGSSVGTGVGSSVGIVGGAGSSRNIIVSNGGSSQQSSYANSQSSSTSSSYGSSSGVTGINGGYVVGGNNGIVGGVNGGVINGGGIVGGVNGGVINGGGIVGGINGGVINGGGIVGGVNGGVINGGGIGINRGSSVAVANAASSASSTYGRASAASSASAYTDSSAGIIQAPAPIIIPAVVSANDIAAPQLIPIPAPTPGTATTNVISVISQSNTQVSRTQIVTLRTVQETLIQSIQQATISLNNARAQASAQADTWYFPTEELRRSLLDTFSVATELITQSDTFTTAANRLLSTIEANNIYLQQAWIDRVAKLQAQAQLSLERAAETISFVMEQFAQVTNDMNQYRIGRNEQLQATKIQIDQATRTVEEETRVLGTQLRQMIQSAMQQWSSSLYTKLGANAQVQIENINSIAQGVFGRLDRLQPSELDSVLLETRVAMEQIRSILYANDFSAAQISSSISPINTNIYSLFGNAGSSSSASASASASSSSGGLGGASSSAAASAAASSSSSGRGSSSSAAASAAASSSSGGVGPIITY